MVVKTTLNFSMVPFQLASAVLEAVENNTLSIEPVGLQPVRFVKASAVECGGPKYVHTKGTPLHKSHKASFWHTGPVSWLSARTGWDRCALAPNPY